MNEKKYCRLRHSVTKDEVQLVEDYVDGLHMIRHFFAEAKDGLFREINQQPCRNDEVFGAMWSDTLKGYKGLNWEVIDE